MPLVTIDRATGTNIGNMTENGGLAAAFDGTTGQANTACATKSGGVGGYVGKTLAASKIFGQATVYGSNNRGFLDGASSSVVLNIRGKNGTAPTSRTDGTVIGTSSFTDTSDESAGRTVTSTSTTVWDHIFAEIDGGTVYIAELVLATPVPTPQAVIFG